MDEDDSQKEDDIFWTLKKSHFELVLKAKGKAELYFHSYFWTNYIDNLAQACGQEGSDTREIPELQRMTSLSSRPQLVIDKIRSMPFGKAEYDSFIAQFGGREQINKMQLIEQLQRYLFVAQIDDNLESLKLIEKVLVQL